MPLDHTGSVSLHAPKESRATFNKHTAAMANLDNIQETMYIRNVLHQTYVLVLWIPGAGYVLGKPEDVTTRPEGWEEVGLSSLKNMMQERYDAFLKTTNVLPRAKFYGVAFVKVCLSQPTLAGCPAHVKCNHPTPSSQNYLAHSQYLKLLAHTPDGRHLAFEWGALGKLKFAGDSCWQQIMKEVQEKKDTGVDLDKALSAFIDLIENKGNLVDYDKQQAELQDQAEKAEESKKCKAAVAQAKNRRERMEVRNYVLGVYVFPSCSPLCGTPAGAPLNVE